MSNDQQVLKAFKAWHKKIPEQKSIILAENASRARYVHHLQVQEHALRDAQLMGSRVRRATDFDGLRHDDQFSEHTVYRKSYAKIRKERAGVSS